MHVPASPRTRRGPLLAFAACLFALALAAGAGCTSSASAPPAPKPIRLARSFDAISASGAKVGRVQVSLAVNSEGHATVEATLTNSSAVPLGASLNWGWLVGKAWFAQFPTGGADTTVAPAGSAVRLSSSVDATAAASTFRFTVNGVIDPAKGAAAEPYSAVATVPVR